MKLSRLLLNRLIVLEAALRRAKELQRGAVARQNSIRSDEEMVFKFGSVLHGFRR
jgi:hypothetical protein